MAGTYIALAQEASRQGLLGDTETWQQLAMKHGKVDIALYDAIIMAAGKTQNASAAVACFDRAKKAVRPRLSTFNAMIQAVGNEGLRPAERWFAKTIEAGLRPDRLTFTAMVHVAAKHRDLQSAEGWFRAAQNAGIQADLIMYTALLDSAAKASKPHLADQWFEELTAQGLVPDAVAYTTLMEAHARAGAMSRAEEFFKEIASFELRGEKMR